MTATFPERTFTFDRHATELPKVGPWVDEPDKIQWVDERTGLDCLIVRGPAGALCGYVGVPEGHPAYKKSYEEVYEYYEDISVHGGLTFANVCDDSHGDDAICHVPYPGRTDKVWWLGFDCSHAGDLSPKYMELLADVPGFSTNRRDVYRTVDYVRQEVTDLASQLTYVITESEFE